MVLSYLYKRQYIIFHRALYLVLFLVYVYCFLGEEFNLGPQRLKAKVINKNSSNFTNSFSNNNLVLLRKSHQEIITCTCHSFSYFNFHCDYFIFFTFNYSQN